MDRYVIAGFPVKHSRSPAIHARFAAATGEPVQYDRLEIEPGQFAARVRAFAAEGGRGCNITVPYKLEAWQLATHRTPRAELAGAANTLRFDAEGWSVDNTDGAGLVHDITVNAGVPLAGARVLLIGAGGAGLGALGPLIEARPAAIRMVNRTVAKAEQAVARHAALAAAHGVELSAGSLDEAGAGFDIVINATSSSLAGAASPVDAAAIRPGTLVLDMMYGAAARPFLNWAQGHGAVVRDGLGMLVEQAAEAFAFWRGVRPPTDGVLAALRAEVDAA